MIGISKALETDLRARGYSEADIVTLFGPKAHRGELRVVYQRNADGDRTAALPSSRHMYYVQKGWTAVAIGDEAPARPAERRELPASMADHAKADRRAVYRRGEAEAIYSTRQHADLEAKGWTFVRLETPRESYLATRNKPYPSAAELTHAATLPHVDEAPAAAAPAGKE
jgi:hypothetical protein